MTSDDEGATDQGHPDDQGHPPEGGKAATPKGAATKGAKTQGTQGNGEPCPRNQHTWKTRVATDATVIATQGNSKCTTCGATRRVSQ